MLKSHNYMDSISKIGVHYTSEFLRLKSQRMISLKKLKYLEEF